ncbi:type III secretion system chaperone, partial [Criblamydia sequanensis]|uniref:Type III secretion chaperone SycE n=1 Tax=Candidatus Criblamydia sequanensis CRIB-18 TaxID=1437425 RepID=A0A090CXR1_9BACT
MKLGDVLFEYGKKYGETLSKNDLGITTLRVNDEFIISFEESLDQRFIFIYSIVQVIPKGKEGEDLLVSALEGNLFGNETGKATFGYDPHTKSLVLFLRLENETFNLKTLESEIEGFIAYLAYWKAKIIELRRKEPSLK